MCALKTTNKQVALRAARTRPDMVRAMVLTAPAVLNPLDSKFVMGRDPSASLFSSITKLRTRVEMTAKLAAFNLQVCCAVEFIHDNASRIHARKRGIKVVFSSHSVHIQRYVPRVKR